MRFKLLIIIGSIGITMLGFGDQQPQPSDGRQWLTHTSEKDLETTVIYKVQADFDGKHFESIIYGRDLQGVEKWKEGTELPLALTSIRAKAKAAFISKFGASTSVNIRSITLEHLILVDDWIINIEFDSTDWAKSYSSENNTINMLILLNGRIMPPFGSSK